MPVIKSDGGFTLLEFLVAVLILMVGMLGLLQAVNLSISTNMATQLRNMGVVAADQILSDRLSNIGPSSSCTESTSYTSVSMKVLNAYKNYSATIFNTCPPSTASSNIHKVAVQVRWRYQNTEYSHDASSVVSR